MLVIGLAGEDMILVVKGKGVVPEMPDTIMCGVNHVLAVISLSYLRRDYSGQGSNTQITQAFALFKKKTFQSVALREAFIRKKTEIVWHFTPFSEVW